MREKPACIGLSNWPHRINPVRDVSALHARSGAGAFPAATSATRLPFLIPPKSQNLSSLARVKPEVSTLNIFQGLELDLRGIFQGLVS